MTKNNPRSVVTQFIAKRSLSGGLAWGALFGFVTFTSAEGFLQAFPTALDKAKVALDFGSNVGLKALLGIPHAINMVAGFTEWRAQGIIALIGGIWGLMLASKLLRGDEEEGRWELLLSGATSQRRATAQALIGMAAGLFGLFLITFLIVFSAGHIHDIAFSAKSSLYFALAITASPAMFMTIGALTSQLGATRRQALSLAAIFFGLCFLLRALADSTTGHDWLRNISPLGWIELVRPLTDPHLSWFIPIVLLILVGAFLTYYLAGKRDLGDSLLKERTPTKANLLGLGSTWGLALRLSKNSIIGWLIAVALAVTAFGGIAKSAAQAFADSSSIQNVLGRITNLSDNAALFLGLIFMLLMIFIMFMAVGSLTSLREEEGSSRLDNLLVRPVSRVKWLAGRLLMAVVGISLAGLVIGLGGWISTHAQGLDLSLSRMLYAGLNTIFPSIFLLGLGVLVFGLAPRLTAAAGYAVIISSFLIQFIASALNVKQWVLQLSILHYTALAPATDPNWHNNWTMALLGLGGMLLGAFFFTRRDVTVE